ncbi:MAG: hypothetical protein ACU0BB_02830 [Paracoccaceae bacterium]|jgi:hypothetical protein
MLRALPFLFLATPVFAQSHSACYDIGHLPENAPAATEAQSRTVAGLSEGYHLIPIYFKKICGGDEAGTRAFVDAMLAHVQCGADTTLAKEHATFLSLSAAEMGQQFVGCDVPSVVEADDLAAFCTVVDRFEITALGQTTSADDTADTRGLKDAYGAFESLTQYIPQTGC